MSLGARSLGLATAAGLGVAAVVAVVLGILSAVFDLTAGLLAAAGLGGWLIGVVVRAPSVEVDPASQRGKRALVAAACGAFAWLGGLVASWLVSMVILQGSTRSFTDRLAATPFLDWVGPQLGLLDLLDLALLVGVAWRTAR
jgi:hypothetical protein